MNFNTHTTEYLFMIITNDLCLGSPPYNLDMFCYLHNYWSVVLEYMKYFSLGIQGSSYVERVKYVTFTYHHSKVFETDKNSTSCPFFL
jgi:hypothetical protein